MYFRILYETEGEKYEIFRYVRYDLELGFFLKHFCEEIGFDYDECVFFWWREGLPVKQLLCNETPEETGMNKYKTYTVDFFLPHLYPDVRKEPVLLESKTPEEPVLLESETPEELMLVEYSDDDYNKDYRKRSGLASWTSSAWRPLPPSGTFTTHDLGVDPDEVY